MLSVYVIVSRIYSSCRRSYILMRKQCLMFMLLLAASKSDYFCNLINSKSDATYTRTDLLMRKQCLMFMLLLAASKSDYFCNLINSKSDATYTRTDLLMRKQCLMFMLLLAASEHSKTIENEIWKRYCRVVQSYYLR